VSIVFEQFGDPALPANRTIYILPSFSHGSHVASNVDDMSPGWWEGMVGPGKWIDTNYFRVICASNIGSPMGSTSPITIDPATGKEYGSTFPQITPKDIVKGHASVLDFLGIEKVHAVVGGSFGGIQALQFASTYNDRLDRAVAISSTGRTTPGTVAFRRVQRQIILSDPEYKNGMYEKGKGPFRGLSIARQLGMITYRSREEFDDRFNWDVAGDTHWTQPTFEVEHYMAYQGTKFSTKYDANCYLLLSKCMDLMDLGRGYDMYSTGVQRIKVPLLSLGVNQDLLIPCEEQENIIKIMQKYNHKECHFEALSSAYGHDAMFHDDMYPWFGSRIKNWIERGIEGDLEEEARHTTGLSGP
jgi:homoserine O-acetyltransferase